MEGELLHAANIVLAIKSIAKQPVCGGEGR